MANHNWNLLALVGGAAMLAGCHTDMWRQPKVTHQQQSDFFIDGMGDRPTPSGVVARGRVKSDPLKFKGRQSTGKLATRLPDVIMIGGKKLNPNDKADLAEILKRGQERFKIVCSHCHGVLGDGNGMIAQRGLTLRRPVGNYHTDRLRKMPIGHFFDVQTNGFGVMFRMSPRVDVDDRWAIAAYIRALQLSQLAPIESLPVSDREKLGLVEGVPGVNPGERGNRGGGR